MSQAVQLQLLRQEIYGSSASSTGRGEEDCLFEPELPLVCIRAAGGCARAPGIWEGAGKEALLPSTWLHGAVFRTGLSLLRGTNKS